MVQAHDPAQRLPLLIRHLSELDNRLRRALKQHLRHQQQRLSADAGRLHALSPLATLERGYSITRRLPDGGLLRDTTQIKAGEQLETRLSRGRITSRVESIFEEE